MKKRNLWDIFCKVIDNFGDIGICWRLAVGLSARGERVRLWLDDSRALTWLAPAGDPRVEVRIWHPAIETSNFTVGDVLVEAFGCEIPASFIAAYATAKRHGGDNCNWINLEYLSAESYVERNHGLPSPVTDGPGAGLRKHFFYPGFSAATGGLLREPDLIQRQSRFNRVRWLQLHGIEFKTERLVSLFCYEPPALDYLLQRLANDAQPTRLLVTAGRAAAATRMCIDDKCKASPGWNSRNRLLISYLPQLTQHDFDQLLWSCDLNFVRGEDSLVRAIWANKPFIWQIYPQDDDAHHYKLDAFLNLLKAPPSLRSMHQIWNGTSRQATATMELPLWQQTVSKARGSLCLQDDLVTQIIRFASKNH